MDSIYILDDASNDGTVEALKQIDDCRLHVDRNDSRIGVLKDGAMPNWYRLLEKCDGKFALHLNDRDLIDANGIVNLVEFLEEHPTMTGGICNLMGGGTKYMNRLRAHLWRCHIWGRTQPA